jgi:8-oxo-dGTP pyrophosphatase MutT (NUDIX family)
MEVMLVTSRGTKRWIIPKGWPIAEKEPHTCAATEALEEAGLVGAIGSQALGAYEYDKRPKCGDVAMSRRGIPVGGA